MGLLTTTFGTSAVLVCVTGVSVAGPTRSHTVEGVARDAVGRAIVVDASGTSWTVRGLTAWPAGISGQAVAVTGSPEPAPAPTEGARTVEGGTAGGAKAERALAQATWALRPPSGQWKVQISDGSGNATTVEATVDGVRWRYAPVVAERSSSGVYSGGEPAAGSARPAAVQALWAAVGQARAALAEQGAARSMGTVLVRLEGSGGEAVIILSPGHAAEALLSALTGLR